MRSVRLEVTVVLDDTVKERPSHQMLVDRVCDGVRYLDGVVLVGASVASDKVAIVTKGTNGAADEH